jgi:hypothetical protein
MALAFTKFNCFVADLGLEKHQLDTDSLKIALSNTEPVVTNTVLSNITQIASGNGYSAGGLALANSAYSQTSGVGKLTADDLLFTASGGSWPAFTYAVLYNDTEATKPLIGWWARASSLTLADGESWLLDFSPTNGLLQIA